MADRSAKDGGPAGRPGGRVASMTGYAAVDGTFHGGGANVAAAGAAAPVRWTWEARAVNGRSLDLKLRLPPGRDRLEAEARRRIGAVLARGTVTVTLSVERPAATTYRVNEAQLAAHLATIERLCRDHALERPRADAVLGLKGVLEPAEDGPGEDAALEEALLAGLDDLAERLSASRLEEGARLAGVLADQLDGIEGIVRRIGQTARGAPDLLRARILRQIGELAEGVPALPPERLAQEVALLATKADISEELARLSAHVAAARDLLAAGGAIGRRLDFLAQEFNREANTICSKAADTEVTRGGLALKAEIERMREQIQNIE